LTAAVLIDDLARHAVPKRNFDLRVGFDQAFQKFAQPQECGVEDGADGVSYRALDEKSLAERTQTA
jgi:hypothetical protein